MRKLFSGLVILITGIALTSITTAGTPPVLDRDRTVVIAGAIDGQALVPIAKAIDRLSNDKSGKPIDMIIASPGGEVISGFLFINIMESAKARGTHIRCYVPNVAASMAFQILLQCNERYTLDRAFLLWHRARTFVQNAAVTAPMAQQLATDLQALDDVILSDIMKALVPDMSTDEIVYHFEVETLHIGSALASKAPHFITSFAVIPGLLELLKDPKVVRTGPGASDRLEKKQKDGTGSGEPIYISPIPTSGDK